MLGYGASMVNAGDHDIGLSSQVDRPLAWRDEVGLKDAVLVGHDTGRRLAQLAAARAPGRFSAWFCPTWSATTLGRSSVETMRASSKLLRHLPAFAIYRPSSGWCWVATTTSRWRERRSAAHSGVWGRCGARPTRSRR